MKSKERNKLQSVRQSILFSDDLARRFVKSSCRLFNELLPLSNYLKVCGVQFDWRLLITVFLPPTRRKEFLCGKNSLQQQLLQVSPPRADKDFRSTTKMTVNDRRTPQQASKPRVAVCHCQWPLTAKTPQNQWIDEKQGRIVQTAISIINKRQEML